MVTFEQLLGIGLAPRTAYLYARMLDRVVPLLEQRGVDLMSCKAPDVAAVAECFTRSYSQRRMLRSSMKAAWEVLERDDAPLRALRVPPRPRPVCRALSEDGARRLEAKAWELRFEEAGLATLIGLYAGFRAAEIARVRWEDVLVDELGRPAWLRVRGKGDKEDRVPIHPVLVEVLAGQRRAGGWLFPSSLTRRLGQPVRPSTIWFWVRQLSELAGLERVPTHVLRHTALAEANDRTGNLRAVQEFARHSRPETTAGYTRTRDEILRQVVASIDYGRRPA